MSSSPSMSPNAALDLIKQGYERFSSGTPRYGSGANADRRKELLGGQSPYAIVLTCSDSRVSPEHIFDAGLGDLFICRNAGNLLDELTLGSIEYAAAHTGSPLLVVMGHTSCGAVTAAVGAAEDPSHHETANVDDIVRRLMPPVVGTTDRDDKQAWIRKATYKNVGMVCDQITQRSPLLAEKIKSGDFKVIGAVYDLAGTVEFI